ncbi:hypothetical protein [Microbacterium trichothecenolyticum]|uniref:Uncharacterized protein n=1 Tax=Microbacterium trichothecenolyticum TaxID=69370 RepID=A0A0M2HL17_MICTR|nr:hypothetical protein [Microbacterium trichothecenolyticum]KJL45595.1 hypothetical protein RS82_00147 [Microbacterium trichothecenolyticum]
MIGPTHASTMRLADFLDDRCRMYALSAAYREKLQRERPSPGQLARMRSGRA